MADTRKDIVPFRDLNAGGLADSRWSGVKNSLYKMTGVDVHSTPGLLKVAQKMTKISGATIDEFCKERVVSSNGFVYWFSSSSGKIWEQKLSDNSFTLVLTTTAAAGEVKCLGAREYQGYIYWATESRLHRILATDAEGATEWATNKVLNWATFTTTDKLFHPMCEFYGTNVLYIGDGNLVAQVDAGTFSANALDIKTPLRIKSLGMSRSDLLIGTWVADTITGTRIIKWNTWSDGFSSTDEIPEVGINAFIPADNFVLVNAGLAGNLYTYNGNTGALDLYKTIPGEYSPTQYGLVNPSSVGNLKGSLLIGFSNGLGNPADCGVYRLSRHDVKYPFILDFPYPISERASGKLVVTNMEIGGIAVSGFNVFVAWKKTIPGTPDTYTYGVDKLDYSNKLEVAYIETRVMAVDRENFSTFEKVAFNYYQIPTDCAIDYEYDKNYGGYAVGATAVVNDKVRNVASEADGGEVTTLSIKVLFTVSGNTAPSIESGKVFLK